MRHNFIKYEHNNDYMAFAESKKDIVDERKKLLVLTIGWTVAFIYYFLAPPSKIANTLFSFVGESTALIITNLVILLTFVYIYLLKGLWSFYQVSKRKIDINLAQ